MDKADILQTIDEFFDEKQKQINAYVEEFGKGKNRDIDSREKSMLLTLPIGYKRKLKEIFAKLLDEVKD